MPKEWYKLSQTKLKILYSYYLLVFIFGIVITIITLLNESLLLKFTITMSSIIGGIGCALIGSTIFYLRKLYKASINLDFSEPNSVDDKIREIGVYYYYFLRPIFSIGFSLFVNVVLRTGVSVVTITESNLSFGFIYMVMFLSFFAGFASGDLIAYIESKSNNVLSNIIKDK